MIESAMIESTNSETSVVRSAYGDEYIRTPSPQLVPEPSQTVTQLDAAFLKRHPAHEQELATDLLRGPSRSEPALAGVEGLFIPFSFRLLKPRAVALPTESPRESTTRRPPVPTQLPAKSPAP